MSKSTGRIPTYGLHRATGQARVVIDGRDHYLGKYGTEESRHRYNDLVATWLASHRRLPPQGDGPADLTITELLLAYVQFAQGYYVKNGRPTSEYSCIKLALRPLQQRYGVLEVADFSPLKLKAFRQILIQAKLSRGVINQHVARVRRAFRWGVENELVPPSVYQGLAAVKQLLRGRTEALETEPVKPVPDRHVEAIQPYVSTTIWAMVQLQLLTGMRPGEVRRTRRQDFDTNRPIWQYLPSEHKTEHRGRERVIHIGPRAQAVLHPFLTTDVSAYLFSPLRSETLRNEERRRKRKSPMTPSQKSRRSGRRRFNSYYTKDAYRTAICRGCLRAGVPPWSPNQLRHTSGTRVRKEFGLEAAQVWLGHSKADVTQLYAEKNLELAREIAAKWG